MTIWDWLATPHGVELEHALIFFLTAISGWVTYKSHQRTRENGRLLNSHLEEHVMQEVSRRESTGGVRSESEHNI